MQRLVVFYAFWLVDFLWGAPLCTCVHLCALVRRVHNIAHMHSCALCASFCSKPSICRNLFFVRRNFDKFSTILASIVFYELCVPTGTGRYCTKVQAWRSAGWWRSFGCRRSWQLQTAQTSSGFSQMTCDPIGVAAPAVRESADSSGTDCQRAS